MTDRWVLALLRLSASTWGQPLSVSPARRLLAYSLVAVFLWVQLAAGLVLLTALVVGLATEGDPMAELAVFTGAWLGVTALGWGVARRTYVMGVRVVGGGFLISGPIASRTLAWHEVSSVRVQESRLAGCRFSVPVIETSDRDHAVWDARIRSLRPRRAAALRDAISAEVSRHAV